MQTKHLIISIIFLITLLAVLTNPTPERHKEAFKNKIYEYIQGPITEDLTKAKTRGEEMVLSAELLFGSKIIDMILDNLISSDNYLLFSTTKISFEGKSKIIGYGAFGNIFLSEELDKNMEQFIKETMKAK